MRCSLHCTTLLQSFPSPPAPCVFKVMCGWPSWLLNWHNHKDIAQLVLGFEVSPAGCWVGCEFAPTNKWLPRQYMVVVAYVNLVSALFQIIFGLLGISLGLRGLRRLLGTGEFWLGLDKNQISSFQSNSQHYLTTRLSKMYFTSVSKNNFSPQFR